MNLGLRNNKRTNYLLYMLVTLLVVSNIYIYREYKVAKRNSEFLDRMVHKISVAAHGWYPELITEESSIKDENHWKKILGEIRGKELQGHSYYYDHYIALKYQDGSTLMVEVGQDWDWDFVIVDMFFLDNEALEELRYSEMR